MDISLGMRAGRFTVVGVVRLVVELGLNAGTEMVDADVERLFVRLVFNVSKDAGDAVVVGEIGLLSPKLELIALLIPAEVEGVVRDTTTSTNDDVRKQTSQRISITSTLCPSC